MAHYGIENFTVNTIAITKSAERLGVLEKEYIQEYGCKIPNGYNMTAGGKGMTGHRHSESTRLSMSALKKGHIISDATKKNCVLPLQDALSPEKRLNDADLNASVQSGPLRKRNEYQMDALVRGC